MLDRTALLGLLEDLAAELSAWPYGARCSSSRAAAMALAYNSRRSTHDIDAVFEPKAVIYAAAEGVAAARGVNPAWLNDAVKGFLPGTDPAATVLFERPGLAFALLPPGTCWP